MVNVESRVIEGMVKVDDQLQDIICEIGKYLDEGIWDAIVGIIYEPLEKMGNMIFERFDYTKLETLEDMGDTRDGSWDWIEGYEYPGVRGLGLINEELMIQIDNIYEPFVEDIKNAVKEANAEFEHITIINYRTLDKEIEE